MKTLQTEVLVIGGGATGTGVLRDLAMRGFRTLLVEKRDLAHGTTGRYHGLLHSGGRYVVKDPQAAQECIEENRILRRIMPHCIEDTGGFFVLTPWDDPQYAEQFLVGCQQAGIPAEEISPAQMLREEPLLNPSITRCFRVPDASADSFLAAEVNVLSALEYGAQALTYHEVIRLLTRPDPSGRAPQRVIGAVCRDLEQDEEITILADMVVNASGAWAGKIAATAGIQVQIRPGKGTMVAVNHRVVNTVVNRCKMPSDGDIIVPAHTVAVIGTTDEQVADPDHFAIEPWEIELMLTEGEKLIPGLRQMRILRAWAGVRPLYQETETSASRDITRAFVLLDHATRDGVEGLVTITSGKWTTYRKMAEVTVDKVCQKLGVQRPCRTHLEPLPTIDGALQYHTLGSRLAHLEGQKSFRGIVCECELATYDEVKRAILQGNARTLDDIRRDTRLGKGPCQGGFCTLRAAGILHSLRKPSIEQINAALRDFLNERWKGVRPILWGSQLRQERLDEFIYRNVLNAGALPGPAGTRLGPEDYEAPLSGPGRTPELTSGPSAPKIELAVPAETGLPTAEPLSENDVLVIGAGLAGLTTAWRAALHGKRVRVIAKGWGAIYSSSGCVDVLGFAPGEDHTPILRPLDALFEKLAENPAHPYAAVGLDGLEAALNAFQELCRQSGYPLLGSLEKNWLLPTALGALRPTCLAPEMMIAGDASHNDPMLIVGFSGFLDFFPALTAANLEAQGIPARGLELDLPSLRQGRSLTALNLARCFDQPEFRQEVIAELKTRLVRTRSLLPKLRVGFPAVLGWQRPMEVWQDLQDQLGCAVFEIPGLPPSLPGIRLHQLLKQAIEKAGGIVFEGMQVIGFEANGGKVEAVWSEAAARAHPHRARQFVLATGGILGGGIIAFPDGRLEEAVFRLPVIIPADRFRPSFLHPEGHPLFRAGVAFDHQFRPVNTDDRPIFENLKLVGSALSGCDPVLERSLEGIALATGFTAGERLAEL